MSKSDYIVEINYLRGFSILLIVICHFFWLWGGGQYLSNTSFQYKFIVNIILGDTILFVFISGFLFYHIFYRRGFPSLSKFMNQKCKNVFSPYIFWGGIMALGQYFIIVYYLKSNLWNNLQSFLMDTFFYWSFWYVPFIMLVFFLSPMYIHFIEASFKLKVFILVGSLLNSLLIGRDNFNPVHSVLYWQTVYLFGIICAQYYERILQAKLKYRLVFMIIYIVITTFCLFRGEVEVNSTIIIFDFPLQFNFVLISKMLFCVVAIVFFRFLSKYKLSFLFVVFDKLAKYSFSIFFLHNFFILLTDSYFAKIGVDIHRNNAHEVFVYDIVTSVAVCICCCIIAAVIKKITGKYSRYFIGA